MDYPCFLGDKSDTIWLDENNMAALNKERLAKTGWNPGNVKLQTGNYKLQFAVSHENPYAKGLYYLKIDSIAKTSENLRWFLSIAVLNGMPVISRKYQLRYVKIYTSLRYLGE